MGGDDGNKKLGSKKVRQLLADLDHGNIASVGNQLVGSFENWMGDTDQLDDVLLIGVKV